MRFKGPVVRLLAKLAVVHEKLRKTQPDALNGVDYLVAEDGGLALDAMGGFPGPYIKPMMQALLSGWSTLACCHREALRRQRCDRSLQHGRALLEKHANTGRDALWQLRGRIVLPRSGMDTAAHGAVSWGPVFEPNGQGGRGIDEFSLEEQAQFSHRRQAVQSFVDCLSVRSRL